MDIQAPRISKAFPEEICEENSKMVRKKCRIRTIPGWSKDVGNFLAFLKKEKTGDF